MLEQSVDSSDVCLQSSYGDDNNNNNKFKQQVTQIYWVVLVLKISIIEFCDDSRTNYYKSCEDYVSSSLTSL